MSRGRRDASAATPAVDPAAGIEAFWAWWGDRGEARVTDGIAAHTVTDLVPEIAGQVEAVGPGLSWELAPGRDARHQLVVTAAGNPALRAVARRWLRAAPPASGTWEYADTRQPSDLGDVTLTLGGQQVALDSVVVSATRRGNALDVAVHHDVLADLSPDEATHVAFLVLDNALGETAVETWIGRIEPSVEVPAGAVPLADLPRLVTELEAEHLDADGEPTWVMLQGTGPDGELLAMAQVPLRASYAPHLDTHVGVLVPYDDRTEVGFPGPASLAQLRQLEDHLTGRLGEAGRLVAHETSAGRRVLHYYVDSTGPAADVLRAAVGGWTQGRVLVQEEPDPSWEAVAHLRT